MRFSRCKKSPFHIITLCVHYKDRKGSRAVEGGSHPPQRSYMELATSETLPKTPAQPVTYVLPLRNSLPPLRSQRQDAALAKLQGPQPSPTFFSAQCEFQAFAQAIYSTWNFVTLPFLPSLQIKVSASRSLPLERLLLFP